jgi:hypothetical protein
LIDKLLDCCVSYDGDDEYIPFGERQGIKAEILRRFEELEDKYENDTGDLIAKIADRDSKIAELEKEVENLQKEYREMGVERDNALVAYENMKCCGTCLHYNHRKEYCPHKDDRDNQSYYKCWIPDGLKRSER